MTELHELTARYEQLCRDWDVLDPNERIVLNEGSKANGRAYRMNRMIEGSSGHYRPPVGDEYLGMTKREARNTLFALIAAMTDLQHRPRL